MLHKIFTTPKIIIPTIAGLVTVTTATIIIAVNLTTPTVTNAETETKVSIEIKTTPTPTPTETPTPTPTPEVKEDIPDTPQPAPPKGVEAPPTDTPYNPSIYTPPATSGFTYVRPNILNITPVDIPSWISYDVNNDNEQFGETEETWNTSLYGYYNSKFGSTYQYEPIEVHAHWWGEPATSPSHDAIVNYIDNKDALTVNFVVSANRITGMMPLTWMATTTGYRNPWAWKMEIDPRLSDDVYKTVGALMYIVERKNPQLANEPIRLHKEFYPTGCSDIDVNYLRSWVNKFASGEYDINTGQPKPVTPPPAPVTPPAPTPSETTTSTPTPTPTVSETPVP